MLELAGVAKSYGPAAALQVTDLRIEPASTTVLIGPSGCGKSTILRLLAGLIRADAGVIYFDGTQVMPQNVLRFRREMGYVIQEGGLFAHLTAGGNVTLMARYLRWPRERIAARLGELCDLARLPVELLGRYPTELSGGQRQRIALMRALMLDPRVLLLDEPLGALDPMVRHELQTDLKRIFRDLNKTVVLVTHDLAEAAYFGDTIVLMRDGRIVQRGTLQDLLDHPSERFVTEFVNAQRSPAGETQMTKVE